VPISHNGYFNEQDKCPLQTIKRVYLDFTRPVSFAFFSFFKTLAEVSTTLRPLYIPQFAHIVCRNFAVPQFAHAEEPLALRAWWERRFPVCERVDLIRTTMKAILLYFIKKGNPALIF